MKRTTLALIALAGIVTATGCDSPARESTQRPGAGRAVDTDRITIEVSSNTAGARPTISITGQTTFYGSSKSTATVDFPEGKTITVTATKGKGTMTCRIVEDGKEKAKKTGSGRCSASWKVDY